MKNENPTLRRAVHLALGAAVLAPLVVDQSQVAFAATGTVETVGSRIGRSSIEGPNPVLVIDREAIDRSGFSTVADILERLPINGGNALDEGFTNSFAPGASSIDLRGLGRNRTLVLLNGRRAASYGFAQNLTEGFVDVNSIPLAAVEQIQVLKDGASAVYGADAVAGVVNVILRKNYEGAEVQIGYGDTQDGGAAETTFSLVAGKAFGKSNATVVMDYFKRDELWLVDRDFSRSADQSRTRNGDGFNFNSSYGNPGSALTSTGFQPDPACGAQPPSTFSNGYPGTYGQIAGGRCRFDYSPFITAIPETERMGIYGQFEVELSPTVTGWIEAGYQSNNSKQQAAPTPITSFPIVYASNPYNPFGEDVYLLMRLTDAGPRKLELDSNTTRFLGGLKGTVGQYDWETAYLYTKSDTEQKEKNYVSSAGIQQALTDLRLIPFGGVTQNRDVINSLYINTGKEGTSELWLVDGKVTGPAWGWKLPGGPVNFALGAEFRHEQGEDVPDPFTLRGDVEASGGTASQGERDVTSVYGELQMPVTENLELLAALRYETSDSKSDAFPGAGGSFDSTDPKVSFRYVVSDAVSFRGSIGTAFRAPALVEQFLGNSVSFVNATDTVRCNVTGADGDCGGSQYQQTFGGNPDLKPEEADTWNLGMVLQFTPQLSATVDWWNIDHKDLIANDTQNLLDTAGTDPARVQRRAASPADIALGIPGEISNINDSFFNLSKQETSGLDIDVRYDSDSWYYGVSATRWLEFKQATLETDPLESVLGTRSGDYSFPEWRAIGWIGHRWADWDGQVSFRWESSVLDSTEGPNGVHYIPSLQEMDISLAYTGFKNMRVTVGCTNCTNEDPPFTYDEFEGYEVGRGDPRGAFWYARLKYDLGAGMRKAKK